MKTKALLIAATAFTLTAAAVPAATASDAPFGVSMTTEAMGRTQAMRTLKAYFRDRGRDVKIARTWTKGDTFYADVHRRRGGRIGTYAIDLDSGRIKRVK